jgi:hypothetical protein
LLRGWFPGWSGWGWYGGQAPPPEAAEHSPSQERVDDTLDEAQFGRICLTSFNCAIKKSSFTEQEILDVLQDSAENDTLLKRDTVFAQIYFCLKGCTVQLLKSEPAGML